MEEHNRYREEEKEIEEKKKNNKKKTKMKNDGEKEETIKEPNTEETKEVSQEKNDDTNEEVITSVDELDSYQEELLNEIANLKDLLLRNRAELENFKKRINEERIKERKYALKDFLMELIEVVDIFDKAVNVNTDDEKVKKFLSGFVMINNRFKQILATEGVKKIEALNQPFDPNFHSAMDTIEVEGVEPNIVVEEILAGYMYKDRVLRPSIVKVSK